MNYVQKMKDLITWFIKHFMIHKTFHSLLISNSLFYSISSEDHKSESTGSQVFLNLTDSSEIRSDKWATVADMLGPVTGRDMMRHDMGCCWTDLQRLDKGPEERADALSFAQQLPQSHYSEETEECDGHFGALALPFGLRVCKAEKERDYFQQQENIWGNQSKLLQWKASKIWYFRFEPLTSPCPPPPCIQCREHCRKKNRMITG